MDITSISASSYNLLDVCEFRWFLRYVLGLEDTSIPAGLLGSIAHDALEEASLYAINEGVHEVPDEEHPAHYKTLWDKHSQKYEESEPDVFRRIKNPDYNKVYAALEKMCYDKHSPYSAQTLSAEQHFKIDISDEFKIKGLAQGEPCDMPLIGKIDRIEQISDDTIEVIDYKTSSTKSKSLLDKTDKTYDDMFYDIQLGMYYLAAKQLHPEFDNILVTLIYLKLGETYTIPFGESQGEVVINKIRERVEEIKGVEFPRRNQGWWCKWMCAYGSKHDYNLSPCARIHSEITNYGMDFVQNMYQVTTGKTDRMNQKK